MAGEITFFELGVDDPDRSRTFYGGLVGWSFEPGPSGASGGFMIGGAGVPGGVHGNDRGASPCGRFRMCVDDQGSPFGLHQPSAT